MKVSKALFLLFLLFSISTHGQQKEVYISKKSFEVGEIFQVRYELTYPIGTKFEFYPPSQTFPCQRVAMQSNLKGETFKALEILNYHDSTLSEGNNARWYADFQMVAWDSGSLILAALPIRINDENENFSAILVESNLVKPKKGVPLYDIKESFAPLKKKFIFKEFMQDYGWYILVFVVLLVGIFVYQKRKHAKKPIPKVATLKTQTLESIEKIHEKAHWKVDQKVHYTELSFILRWYLTSRFNIRLLERTTQEAKILLELKKLEPHLIVRITDVLNQTDAVKFANVQLTEEMHLLLIEQLKEIVILTSPIEIADV
jgi:hypothetical protein